MKTQKIQEIAIEYGVPTPETCQKLNWQRESNFYWVGLHSGNYKDTQYYLAYLVNEGNVEWLIIKEENSTTKRMKKDLPNVIPAPQMHEILPLFPRKRGKELFIFQQVRKYESIKSNEELEKGYSDEYLIFDSTHFAVGKSINLDIYYSHYAEAYAKIYLKLKGEGLL